MGQFRDGQRHFRRFRRQQRSSHVRRLSRRRRRRRNVVPQSWNDKGSTFVALTRSRDWQLSGHDLKNTHPSGKDPWKAGLQYNWIGFFQTKYVAICMCSNYLIRTSQTGDQPTRDASP